MGGSVIILVVLFINKFSETSEINLQLMPYKLVIIVFFFPLI